MSRKLLIRRATVVSVDKDVLTETGAEEPAWENMGGKLSRIGNGNRMRDLQMRSVSCAKREALT